MCNLPVRIIKLACSNPFFAPLRHEGQFPRGETKGGDESPVFKSVSTRWSRIGASLACSSSRYLGKGVRPCMQSQRCDLDGLLPCPEIVETVVMCIFLRSPSDSGVALPRRLLLLLMP